MDNLMLLDIECLDVNELLRRAWKIRWWRSW